MSRSIHLRVGERESVSDEWPTPSISRVSTIRSPSWKQNLVESAKFENSYILAKWSQIRIRSRLNLLSTHLPEFPPKSSCPKCPNPRVRSCCLPRPFDYRQICTHNERSSELVNLSKIPLPRICTRSYGRYSNWGWKSSLIGEIKNFRLVKVEQKFYEFSQCGETQ